MTILRTVASLLMLVLAACQSAPRQNPGADAAPAVDMEATLELAESAYAAHDWSAAEPHYVALTREFPQQADLWFRLANIYGHTDRPDLAVSAYRETLVRKPDFAKAWFNMGVVQLRQAANSFHKMGVHVGADDPSLAQATLAYQRIQAILEDDAPTGSTAALPLEAPLEAAAEAPVAGSPSMMNDDAP